MSRARVAVIMTVYNRVDDTLACLASLRDQEGHSARLDVFVVDDASTDGTAHAIDEQFPDVTVLRGDGSLFWNGGMRLAFATAMEGDYDAYLWMNDDTTLNSKAVALLLDTERDLRQRGETAIVVGSTTHPDTGELSYGGVHRPSRRRPLAFQLLEPGDEPRECETMNGNCVLVPREVARRIGNIDPSYRQKMGDFDYGLRARKAGFSIWIVPGYVGECATHPPRRTDERPLVDEIRRLWSIKELPFRAWGTFTRRWAGPLWPAYFVSPYLRRGAGLVIERLARGRPLSAHGKATRS